MFSYNIFRSGDDIILAISDKAIVGKIFEGNDIQLEVSEEFYSGKTCSDKEAVKLIKSATIINAVGNNIISLMLEKKLIEKNKVLDIGGILHAQIVSVREP